VSTDLIPVIAAIACETVLIALLLWRRAYRLLPVFCGYIAWDLVSDCVMPLLRNRFPNQYLTMYLVEMCLDSLFQFGVLVELAWSVLRPFRGSLQRGMVWRISIGILFLGAVVWLFTTVQGAARLPTEWLIVARLQQTFSALRILFFLLFAGGSHALSIGWRDRELQVATGLGFYSIVSMVGTVVHTHQRVGHAYQVVDLAVAGSFLCSLVYWVISFMQKEPPRREFTPQMQDFLLSVAGRTRTT
jgi:hypothetical protein